VRYLQSTPPFAALPAARERHDKTPPAPLLAAAVHAQSEGVLIAARRWTRNGLRILFANESFCAMTGYTGAELRERGQGFLHENKKDQTELHHWQTRLEPGSILSGEGFLKCKDGARVYSAWNYCTVSDEHGKVTHIVATYRDLTEKRRLQEALIHSQRLDAVGRLAGGVAHDFNNLLSVINGYCEMMVSKRSVRKLAARELEEIHQASQKAAHLVRQLLAFSRRQANNPRIINLDQLVRDNSSILTRLLKPARSMEFSLTAGASNIRVDPAQIQQVLLNLTLNARDALPEGGSATISTSIRQVCTDERYPDKLHPHALLSVADNGSGMDEEVRAHLFEPFFTTKETGKGTGLGLSLVYGVVQQSNGFIRVHSTPGRGSTFEIFLPLVDKPAQQLSTTLPPLPSTQGREHILLIEEDDVVRNMVADIFRADGYTVDAVSAANNALELLRKQHQRIDLLIIQTGTKPSRDEQTLAQGLHLMLPGVRVLAIGSPDHAPFPDLNPAFQACLPKPFTLSSLLKAARGLLDVNPAHTRR
jgi:two-component system, cell cycle sensor histidine kinase and response regulator CckA